MPAAMKLELAGIGTHQVLLLDLPCECVEMRFGLLVVQARQGATQQRRYIGMFAMASFRSNGSHSVVRPRTLSLGGRDQQVVSVHGQRAGIPLCRDETQSGRA